MDGIKKEPVAWAVVIEHAPIFGREIVYTSQSAKDAQDKAAEMGKTYPTKVVPLFVLEVDVC